MSTTLAHGPLNVLLKSSAAQYATLGFVGAYVFLGPDRVFEILRSTAQQVAVPKHGGDSSTTRTTPSPPVVFHYMGSSNEKTDSSGSSGALLVVIGYGAGAYALFYLFQNVLPEQLKQLLPVNRKVFESATQKLARAVVHVKDALGKQILGVLKKQDDLAKKQDEMGKDVKEVKGDVKQACEELSDLHDSIRRCEDSLDDTHRLQSYTARGVSLLVRVVQRVVQDDGAVYKELEEYQRDWNTLQQIHRKVNGTSSTATTKHRITPQHEEGHPQRITAAPNNSSSSSKPFLFDFINTKEISPSKVPVSKQPLAFQLPTEGVVSPEEEHHPRYFPSRQSTRVSADADLDAMSDILGMLRS